MSQRTAGGRGFAMVSIQRLLMKLYDCQKKQIVVAY